MPGFPSSAPVLSTPDTHIVEAQTALTHPPPPQAISDEDFATKYEISRTASEVKAGKWHTIALQFPDSLLPDASRVVEALQAELQRLPHPPLPTEDAAETISPSALETSFNDLPTSSDTTPSPRSSRPNKEKLYILADTSYGSCCADEIAAEHVSADVLIHYGRACLSPTSRLPVIYVFTMQPLAHEPLVASFKATYPDLAAKIVLMADVMFSSHVPALVARLAGEGYTALFAPDVRHDPASALPNRTVPPDVAGDAGMLRGYHLFHVSDPAPALLLTLSSRVASIHVYPTSPSPSQTTPPKPLLASTAALLRRRYALLTSLASVPIVGILATTLSVTSYLSAISRLQSLLAAGGKKSYLFVVGKLNPAKLANFAEVGGWVVVGCWESSLVEETAGNGGAFWRPVVVPFEIEVLLKGDGGRVWGDRWEGGFGGLVGGREEGKREDGAKDEGDGNGEEGDSVDGEEDGGEEEEAEEGNASEEESEPPEFDLRTGRYVSRPTRSVSRRKPAKSTNGASGASASLVKRAKGDLAVIGGQVSPGAEFLRSQRTWRGLGSEIEIAYEDGGEEEVSTGVEEGRRGIARGYVGEEGKEGQGGVRVEQMY